VTVLWIKSLHIVFLVTWYAGLFYLPRLFVYHAMAEDTAGRERFEIMERKLYWGIMAPGALLTIVFGAWLFVYGVAGAWLYAKLGVVALTLAYHAYCGKLMLDFARDRNTKSHVWYRWFNEVPVVFLIATVVLAVVKPF
jgi:protoporphyrinogen IX oxidase